MIRSTLSRAARGVALAFSRATFVKADDSRKMQEVTLEGLFGEKIEKVEFWHPYGHSSVPLAPDQNAQPEALVVYLGGNRSHPVVLAIADRRHRPKNMKPGEIAHHDDQKQVTKIGRDGIETVGKQVSITAGDKPDPTPELNEQMKGLAARVAQAENQIHGVFDVASKLRVNLENVIPALAAINLATQVTSVLNALPTGLDAAITQIEGKAQAYLQKTIEQALAKFLNPNLAALASVLSGGLEAAIRDLEGQIAALAAANPIVALVDDLQAELAALSTSGLEAAARAAAMGALQARIDGLVAANPIIGTVAGLRASLQNLVAQAGPALNFLEPQKRLVQGVTKSVRFTKAA